MLIGVKPTQLTYCVTFTGSAVAYASGWCSRRRHCATDRAGSANQSTFHWHHTHQPATSDHLTPTGWTNHQPDCYRWTTFQSLRATQWRIWNSLPTTVRSA